MTFVYRMVIFVLLYSKILCPLPNHSHPQNLAKSILMLCTYLRLPRGHLPEGFLVKIIYAFLVLATLSAHIDICFNTQTTWSDKYKSQSSSLCRIINNPLTSSSVCQNIFEVVRIQYEKQNT
jgi:hypothetical protein